MRGILRAVLIAVLALLAAAGQAPRDLTSLPAGCTVETFHAAAPAGWFVTNLEEPEGREGCMYVLHQKKSPRAVIELESASETLALFQEGDAFETLAGKIGGGLEANMNVVLERETYRNDRLAISGTSIVDRAAMRVFAANVPGNSQPHEVALVLMHAPGRYFTLFRGDARR